MNSWRKFKHTARCSGFTAVQWKIFKSDISHPR